MNMKIQEVKIEKWESVCLWGYLEEIGYTPTEEEIEDEEFWFAILEEAIEYYKDKDGWDCYVYIPPEDCGEPYGITVWYSLKG